MRRKKGGRRECRVRGREGGGKEGWSEGGREGRRREK